MPRDLRGLKELKGLRGLQGLASRRFAQRFAQRLRGTCASTAGLSLVEVLVAAAIIAIVSVILVYAFYTMGSINVRASDITNADAALTSDIAFGTESDTDDGTLTLTDEQGNPITSIDLDINTFTTEDGRSLRTFGQKDEN
ncbi:MAG: prepilin-type N-terminal cleavage/methylation domain-containing protein [Coriobacteriales bacterium]|nr:prepilin-type N-terminal cleavage/methylation domain-containing protein [Coriobacteriales bacterium]